MIQRFRVCLGLTTIVVWLSMAPGELAAQTCAPAIAQQRLELVGSQVSLLLPSTLQTNTLAVSGQPNGLAYETADASLVGFYVDRTSMGGDAAAEASAIRARINNGMVSLGISANVLENSGSAVQSHDGFPAWHRARHRLLLTAPTELRALHAALLAQILQQPLADLSGPPLSGGPMVADLVFRYGLVRRGDGRLRLLTSLAARDSADIGMSLSPLAEDLAAPRQMALPSYLTPAECFGPTPEPARAVDVLVGNYIGGSLDALRPTIASAMGRLFDQLIGDGVDARFGVVPHTSNERVLGVGNGGVLRSGFVDPSAVGSVSARASFLADIGNVSGTDGCGFTLTAVDNAITRALPRSTPGLREATRFRDDAGILVIYIDGEHAQEIEINSCGLGNLGTGQVDNARTTPSAAQLTAINNLVAPFISRLQMVDAAALGLLAPLNADFCTGLLEDGRGYFDLIEQLGGGARMRVCDAASATFDDGVARHGGRRLPALPEGVVPASVVVSVTRSGAGSATPVPRTDGSGSGFLFDAETRELVLHGAAYLPAIGDVWAVSFVSWGFQFADGFE